MSKPTFTTEFKVDSANLVINQGYSISEACQAVDVSERAMRRWVKQLKGQQRGVTPTGSPESWWWNSNTISSTANA